MVVVVEGGGRVRDSVERGKTTGKVSFRETKDERLDFFQPYLS